MPEPLDEDLEADLREHYRDSDAALAELLGRELPWHAIPVPAPEED